jgi:LPXTG-motif cell wall-anchored protein
VVLGSAANRSLALTGAPSIPLVLIGIILFGTGTALTFVNRRRGVTN